MSDTPRTDSMRGFHDLDTAINAEFCEQLERELNAANAKIKWLEEAIQERDKEWFQVIESILGFHPVSMTEALRIGIERIKKQKQRIKRLEEAGNAMMSEPCEYTFEQWIKAKEAKP